MDKYIIAAGGTGAMCARAFIYTLAAGCAPSEDTYHILLVDKDTQSDAVTACNDLLNNYEAMQKWLTGKYKLPKITVHSWNFTEEIATEYQLRTNLPASDLDQLTLKKLLNPESDPAITELLSTMYSPEELNTDLNKGFYGHPNIGAPVFQYIRDRFLAPEVLDRNKNRVTNSFMKSLHDTLNRGADGKAYVYLFGSLFGGTGATVIPNLVYALRSMTEPNDPANQYGKTKLVLGGTMMMPYFRLPQPPNSKTKELQPEDKKFASQTKEALAYYDESKLLEEMMNLTLLGTSRLDVTSEIFARGGQQKQHFHLTTLLAAVTACRFFANGLGNMAQAVELKPINPLKELILWKIDPNAGNFNTVMAADLSLLEEYEKLVNFLRFCVVIGYYMLAKFEKDKNTIRTYNEVKCTAAQFVGHDNKPLNPKDLSDRAIEEFYQNPVKQMGHICRGYIQFLYDVAMSGNDWSEGNDSNRWVDIANVKKLYDVLNATNPMDVVGRMNLKNILNYQADGREGFKTQAYDYNIGVIYEKDMMDALRMQSGHLFAFGRRQRTDVHFHEIFDQLYEECSKNRTI